MALPETTRLEPGDANSWELEGRTSVSVAVKNESHSTEGTYRMVSGGDSSSYDIGPGTEDEHGADQDGTLINDGDTVLVMTVDLGDPDDE